MTSRRETLAYYRLALLPAFAILASCLHAADPSLPSADEVVCRVNTEKIGKRQVEHRIPPLVFGRLEAWKRKMIEQGRWDEKARAQYYSLLMPEFRSALREVVRERLMLQEAKEKHLQIDKTEFRRRVDEHLQTLHRRGGWVKPDVEGIRTAVRERMLLQAFRNTLVTAFDLPSKPQVEKYYKDRQAQYMLPPLVKLRIIKIGMTRRREKEGPDRFGQETDPLRIADGLRKDVVECGIDFADLAREKSDDEETRAHGGLLHGPDGSPFVDPTQNRLLAPVVRKLGTGSVAERTSDVFQMGKYWAVVFLEERRPAGPAPLDAKLYEKINRTLVEEVVKRKQKEWFAEALKRSLVLDGSPTPKPIPLAFFFPEDPAFGRKVQEAAAGEASNTSRKP